MTTRKSLAIAAALLLAIVPFVLIGCARAPETPAPQPVPQPVPTETPSPEPASESEVLIYLVRGEDIGVGGRVVEAAEDIDGLASAAMSELLEGTTGEEREFGLGSEIPEGTTLNSVFVNDDLAIVDLSPEFQSGGGSLSMMTRAAQVVYTLTQFDGVERVEFRLDGERIDALGGEGIMVGPSVGRDDFEDVTPAILVESPYPGQSVGSPLTVAGTSNTFEATHQLNVTDPNGLIIAERVVTATSGSGERGTWNETVEFTVDREGLGAVIAFEYSAEDGSQVNIVEIPVRMTP